MTKFLNYLILFSAGSTLVLLPWTIVTRPFSKKWPSLQIGFVTLAVFSVYIVLSIELFGKPYFEINFESLILDSLPALGSLLVIQVSIALIIIIAKKNASASSA